MNNTEADLSDLAIAGNQLAQLKQYKKHYEGELTDKCACRPLLSGEVEDYKYFFAKLDEVINDQQTVVSKLAEEHFNDNDNEAMYFGGRQ